MNDKRGISAIMATVLIILITVAAVAIVWAAIIPMIKNNLEMSTACLDADVLIDVSSGYTCYDDEKKILAVQIKKGASEVNIPEIELLLTSAGTSSKVSMPFGLSSNSGKVFYIIAYDDIDGVSVAPVIQIGNSEKACDITSKVNVKSCSLGRDAIGDDTGACDVSKVGTMRWNGSNIQVCDGEAWITVENLPPSITSVSPVSGSLAGGYTITITGNNFVSEATVTIGGVSATDVTFVSATSVTATVPAGASIGAKDIVVTNPDGSNYTLGNGFTYAVYVAPVVPVDPVDPVNPVGPPPAPVGPVNPVNPVGPVVPVKP